MQNSIVVDADVRAVAEFMQGRIAASRLVAVANGLAAMAPLLWGTYQPEPVQALRLDVGAMPSALQTPATST
jgi:hypothetical protein